MKTEFYSNVDSKLILNVKDKIHTRVAFDETVLPTLFFTYEMDCIGLNGAFVGAKSFPFTHSHITIDKYVSHYISVITLLSAEYNKDLKNNNFYLIADQPEDSNTAEYKIWKDVQANPFFKVIRSEESELVAEKVEDTGASKFLATVE